MTGNIRLLMWAKGEKSVSNHTGACFIINLVELVRRREQYTTPPVDPQRACKRSRSHFGNMSKQGLQWKNVKHVEWDPPSLLLSAALVAASHSDKTRVSLQDARVQTDWTP